MKRREFDQATTVAIIKRATDANSAVRCEECHCAVTKWHIDHIDPDAMQIDKSKKLTAEEGQLLCLPCHAEKTKKDVADIARAKRRQARHLGVKKRPSQTIVSAGFAPVDKSTKASRHKPVEKFSGLPPARLMRG